MTAHLQPGTMPPARRLSRVERIRSLRVPSERIDLLLGCIAALVLTTVFRLQSLYPILAKLQLPTLAAVGSYVVYGFDRDPRRKLSGLKGLVLGLALAILAWMLLSVPFAINPFRAASFIIRDHWKNVALMLLVGAAMRTVKDADRYARVLVFGAVLYSIVTLLRFEVGPDGRLARLYYYDANDLAYVLVLTVPFLVYLVRPGVKLWERAFVGVAGVIICVTIVKTGSRGGFVGLAAAGAFILWRYKAVPSRWRVLVVTGLALGLVAFGTDKYWNMMQSILNPTQDYNYESETGRIAVWTRGVGYMAGNPILGVGVDNFGYAEGQSPLALQRAAENRGVMWLAPHNIFVQIGAELGLPGLFLLGALIVTWYRSMGRIVVLRREGAPPEDQSLAAFAQTLQGSCIGYVVAGFFLSQAYSAYLYVLIGMVMGTVKLATPRIAALTPAPAHTPRRSGGFAERRTSRARLRA